MDNGGLGDVSMSAKTLFGGRPQGRSPNVPKTTVSRKSEGIPTNRYGS